MERARKNCSCQYKKCHVLNNPQIVKRKSFGKELVGCKVVDYQDKGRIKYIANKKK